MKQARCNICNKKAGLVPFTCKCDKDKVFCSKHRHDHQCTFDYRKEFQERILEENPVIKHDKLPKV